MGVLKKMLKEADFSEKYNVEVKLNEGIDRGFEEEKE